jgi:NAD-dependent histone deacetylase SIR2
MRKECNGLVKPDIVFFGEALPTEFFMNRGLVTEADLVIVLGTSLTVQPFASLPSMADEGTPRVLVNLEQVGGMGSRADDVLLLGNCDDGVRKLADALGWLGELEELWAETGKRFGTPPAQDQAAGASTERTPDEKLEDEVDKLTREVDETLKLNKEHEDKARGEGEAKLEKDGTEESEAAATTPLTKAATNADSTADKGKTDDGGGGLAHVFPHVEKKAAL